MRYILRIKLEKCFQLNGDSLALYLNKFGCGREGHIQTLIFKLPDAEKGNHHQLSNHWKPKNRN